MEEFVQRKAVRILRLEDDPHDTELVRAMPGEESIACDLQRAPAEKQRS